MLNMLNMSSYYHPTVKHTLLQW